MFAQRIYIFTLTFSRTLVLFVFVSVHLRFRKKNDYIKKKLLLRYKTAQTAALQ